MDDLAFSTQYYTKVLPIVKIENSRAFPKNTGQMHKEPHEQRDVGRLESENGEAFPKGIVDLAR